jgi:pimeloyl-ACP methyl ester carboxylesterase
MCRRHAHIDRKNLVLIQMKARFFGPTASGRLFGVFDEPANGGAGHLGAVLCYPHGADYEAAFRSFRVLGTRLARAGFHVLRFDYMGTGDSAGELEDASIAQWVSDVVTAVHELRNSCQVREVSLVGLRLGATLAAQAAAECQCVDRLVLWEPVIDGAEYVAAQRALHREWVDDEARDGRRAHEAEDELLGYRLTGRLRQELESMSLWSLARAPAPDLHLLSQKPSVEHERLSERLRATGARVQTDCVEGPMIWSRTPAMDEPRVPNAVVQAIVARLAGASR